MASQTGGKGKKRMSNPKRAERRKRAYNRAQRRNEVNRIENESHRDGNLATLKAASLPLVQRKTFRDGKPVTITLSPSKSLRYYRRAGFLPTPTEA